MTTKQVCKKLNITPKALIVYEEYGILNPKRDSNNYRNYSKDDLLKLREVILLKKLGFSLKDIKTLKDNNNYANNQFMRSLYLQLRAVERNINELGNIRNTLKESIDKMLETEEELNYEYFLDNVDVSLQENEANRRHWVDMWGFDNKAVKFDNMIKDAAGDELGLFEKYDEIFSAVRKRILELGAKKIIDIGCGTGNLCGELSESLEVVGIDQSLEMLIRAKKKFSNLKLKLGNFLDKPFCKKQFDVVVTTYAFHSLNPREKKKALTYMLEYLKPQGKIIIIDFMFKNDAEKEKYKNKFLNEKRQDLWEVIDSRYYTDVEELESHADLQGLKIKCEHIINFTWKVEIEF